MVRFFHVIILALFPYILVLVKSYISFDQNIYMFYPKLIYVFGDTNIGVVPLQHDAYIIF